MKYYKVVAKCGHVGRGRYIVKSFYVVANDGKEAAAKVRWLPRVKHHWKNAIEAVCEIDKQDYIDGKLAYWNDKYFQAKNSSQQRLLQCVVLDEICEQESKDYKRKDKNMGYYVAMEKILRNDVRVRLFEVI